MRRGLRLTIRNFVNTIKKGLSNRYHEKGCRGVAHPHGQKPGGHHDTENDSKESESSKMIPEIIDFLLQVLKTYSLGSVPITLRQTTTMRLCKLQCSAALARNMLAMKRKFELCKNKNYKIICLFR